MQLRFDGKVALVTGSSKGIGRGIAERLAEAGADVTLAVHSAGDDAAEVAEAIRSYGRRAEVVEVDVADEASVDRLFEAHRAAFGRIDILVNNAGVGAPGLLHEIPTSSWEKVLRTNLYGSFFCSRLAARQMIAQGDGGRIINISSVHEEAASHGAGPYAVSKAGLRNLTRAMAIELGEHGITVNDVAPGMILTSMNQAALDDPKVREEAAAQIVLRRAGLPADVASMVLFIASDAASYCTGSTFYVDGGWMLTWPPV